MCTPTLDIFLFTIKTLHVLLYTTFFFIIHVTIHTGFYNNSINHQELLFKLILMCDNDER